MASGIPEATPPPPPPPAASPLRAEPAEAARGAGSPRIESQLTSKALVDRFKSDSGRSVAGILPVGVRVPVFGATLFAAAELTEEGRAPTIEIDYKKATRR